MPQRELGTVIVTGGASGLGAAVVQAVADAGGDPVILDIKNGDGRWEHEIVDLADARAAEEAVVRIAGRREGVDAVVCAAGTDSCGLLEEVSGPDWDRVVKVNLIGTAAVVRAALPHLVRTRGRIVTVASTLGRRALPAATAYCASKFGVVGFTRALAAETAGQVGVTLLMPGGWTRRSSTGGIRSTSPRPMPRSTARRTSRRPSSSRCNSQKGASCVRS